MDIRLICFPPGSRVSPRDVGLPHLRSRSGRTDALSFVNGEQTCSGSCPKQGGVGAVLTDIFFRDPVFFSCMRTGLWFTEFSTCRIFDLFDTCRLGVRMDSPGLRLRPGEVICGQDSLPSGPAAARGVKKPSFAVGVEPSICIWANWASASSMHPSIRSACIDTPPWSKVAAGQGPHTPGAV